MVQLTNEQTEQLMVLAKQQTSTESACDDWNPYDISGGNFDDAYYTGVNDADIENARFILDLFGIDYQS